MAHSSDSRKRSADEAFARDPPAAGDKRARTTATPEPATDPSAPPPADGRRWFTDGRRLGPPATYNKYLSVMAAVKTLGMKEKRELFKLMREGVVGKRGRVTEHTFIPRLGVTMGEFALFYVLIDNPRAPS
ncbi:hypothetical protein pqer_cds_279 [Pandoravirus quercus]|uniref:Cyclic nucleotide-binding domain-containing protein n=2 Tax=Pandoravirus TaxID=2060084 RepID=A0A2U7U8D2_9VIRU|nr:hypothetical protein pqer_cds_279 [Pandoravirus quercus]AVK74701.1 hypothetical protein pqer_cds_279 [Pandoravirus quercus]QBZ80878.1 hypothetical protein pclt_cds_280 [Pandoravirus celtis]